MKEDALLPFVSERFKYEPRYREGHLRVINALPGRKVLGLHVPEMKQIAKTWTKTFGRDLITSFSSVPTDSLCHEEIVIWGLMINNLPCSVQERFSMLQDYVPVLDNWAVCDTYCSHAKWMEKVDKTHLWSFLQPWFASEREFEVRFAIVVSMCYFLHDDWIEQVFSRIGAIDYSHIRSEYRTCKGKPAHAQMGVVQGTSPYYVRMAVAWLLATALSRFPGKTRTFVRSSELPADVIKIYVRKAKESFRTRMVDAF